MILLSALAGCGPDPEQSQLCERLMTAFVGPDHQLVDAEALDSGPAGRPPAVRISYRAGGALRWHVCRFAGSGFEQGRLELASVETDRDGRLTPIQLDLLRVWLDLPEGEKGRAPAVWPSGPSGELLYFVQTVINALAICCLYGLLAVGYSLVYGIIERINLAFGQITMVAAFAALLATLALVGEESGRMWRAGGALTGLLVVLAAGAGSGALYAWASDRLALKRLRGGSSQMMLIATIGIAIVLPEAVRLLQGAGEHWLAPPLPQRVELVSFGGVWTGVTLGQIAVVGLTLAASLLLFAGLRHSRLGLQLRATADDRKAAALMGIDVDRIVGASFALGGLFAGLGGVVLTLYYGGVGFNAGALIGFKALTAAIVGGIGSLPGALLGGVLIGLLETFWSAYLSLAYKDIAIFSLLTLVLIFRPYGLLGRARDWSDGL
ncbi:branched-chain amino acid ABC transporter permease [Tistlia consotensis]|uniref:branched-chain amino acid ABC transporter permease n=1 Tax=Tistlia consotensis TaxID=1321365 RepID=UPI001F3B9AD1|nr:branched-chain amino acid ABC transporter permease [Tistlia consotensis]